MLGMRCSKIGLVVCFLIISCTCFQRNRLTVIISDGFAGHYLTRYKQLPAFAKFMDFGVWSDQLIPQFPTLSLPNHYSILTGFPPAAHGIVSDYMIDSASTKQFNGGSSVNDFKDYWWDKKTPFWETAIKSGLTVGGFYWMGCSRRKVKMSACKDYQPDGIKPALSLKNARETGVALSVYDLNLVYHNAIDRESLVTGIYKIHSKPNNTIKDFDKILQIFLNATDEFPDENLLVVSPHGMTEIPPENRRYLDDYIDMSWIFQTVERGAIKQISPNPNKAQEIFHRLNKTNPIPNVSIHWTPANKNTLPRHMSYYQTSRIPELILVAEPGYGIYVRNTNKQFPTKQSNGTLGIHGYDPEHPHMAGILLAYGPAFKKGYYKRKVHLLDLHPLICTLLNLTCPQSEGNFARIRDILIGYSGSASISAKTILTITLVITSVLHSV